LKTGPVARLALALRAQGLHDTLGDRGGRSALTGRFPGESKKGLASGEISCSKISDLGENDTDRISISDVTGPRTEIRMSKGEYNGIANGERWCARHREDCAKDSTCLNLPYPLFASGVTGHLRLRTEDGGNGGGSMRTSPTSQGDGAGFPRRGFV
jgi:hypothetical protein